MPTPKYTRQFAPIAFSIVAISIVWGIRIGFWANTNPIYLEITCTLLAISLYIYFFFTKPEKAVLGLLILRSSLDVLPPTPALFALGIDGLTLIYVAWLLLTRQSVKTDRFWWFFAGWTAFQSLWIILLPLGGLGLGIEVLSTGIREWMRLFTWLMIYLLIMQLKDRIEPQKAISLLFLSLVIPLTVGLVQFFLPSALPEFLGNGGLEGLRIRGTLGHPATFSTFLLLFIGLSWWKVSKGKYRLLWASLLGILPFFLVSAKSLSALGMLVTFVGILLVLRLNFINPLISLLLLSLALSLFLGTEFGRERLASLYETPLLNPDLDWSRTILLSWKDQNSFNWRISQWMFLLRAWHNSPLLGHGMGTSSYLTLHNNYAHNDYIRALAEQGIVGLIAFLGFLGVQALRLLQLLLSSPRGSSKRELCLVLLALLGALLVGMLTENIWSHTTLFAYWWTLLAILSWDWQEIETRD